MDLTKLLTEIKNIKENNIELIKVNLELDKLINLRKKIKLKKNYLFNNKENNNLIKYKNESNILGIGDWGLGIGDWAQSPIPNPQFLKIYLNQ